MCSYLAGRDQGMQVRGLELSIVAGRPGENGWDGVRGIERAEFEVLRRVRKEWASNVGAGGGGMDLEWVDQLLMIRGLRHVSVKAMVEHCPAPRSELMAFWVTFSKSVENGFGEWLRGSMLEVN